MKRCTHISAVCLVLAVMSFIPQFSAAQTIRPNADPGIAGEGWVDYVGRYGEVFKLRGGGQIVPFMNAGIEVINLYPTYRPDQAEGAWVRFRPTATDFEPKNFTRLELIQLMIIPRSSDAFRSLDELKAEKIRDLQSSGVDFKVNDHPHRQLFFYLYFDGGN